MGKPVISLGSLAVGFIVGYALAARTLEIVDLEEFIDLDGKDLHI